MHIGYILGPVPIGEEVVQHLLQITPLRTLHLHRTGIIPEGDEVLSLLRHGQEQPYAGDHVPLILVLCEQFVHGEEGLFTIAVVHDYLIVKLARVSIEHQPAPAQELIGKVPESGLDGPVLQQVIQQAL